MDRPEKISKLAYYLMDKEPLFYLFIINTDFIPDEVCFGSEYAAVKYTEGRVNFSYTQKFVDLPIKKLYFILIHEAYHIFKRHLSIHTDLHKINSLLCNISEDAIINNEIISSEFNGIIPDSTGLYPCLIPEDYIYKYKNLKKDAFVTPRLFNYYLSKEKLNKLETIQENKFCKNKKTGKYGKYKFDSDDDKVCIEEYKNLNDMLATKIPTGQVYSKLEDLIPVFINSHDTGYGQAVYTEEFEKYGFLDAIENKQDFENEEVELINQQVFVQKIIKQARDMTDNNPAIKKLAGKNKGNSILQNIESLLNPEISWRKIFKKNINTYFSNNSINKSKKKSILTYLMNAKSSYGFIFRDWIKTKNKLQKYIFVAMDTSGSCFSDTYDMQKFFTEIDKMAEELDFSKDGKVFILQWDWGVQSGFVEYKKGDWKTFHVQGGGGTNPECIFTYISDKLKPVGNSLYGFIDENKKIPLIILDKNKMPLMIIITDGFFYDKMKNDRLGVYKNNEKNILFITKSIHNLFEKANYIKFK